MSDFDDAFRFADAAAAATFGTKTARVWRGDPESGFDIEVIEMPRSITGSFRDGGRQDEIDAEFEATDAAVLRSHGMVEDGWRIDVDGESYRVLEILWQGGTATLRCGSTGDSSPDVE